MDFAVPNYHIILLKESLNKDKYLDLDREDLRSIENIEMLYFSRKDGRRGLDRVQDSVDASI